jgi:hypothetical protein
MLSLIPFAHTIMASNHVLNVVPFFGVSPPEMESGPKDITVFHRLVNSGGLDSGKKLVFKAFFTLSRSLRFKSSNLISVSSYFSNCPPRNSSSSTKFIGSILDTLDLITEHSLVTLSMWLELDDIVGKMCANT